MLGKSTLFEKLKVSNKILQVDNKIFEPLSKQKTQNPKTKRKNYFS